jgi:hypothetical protein
MDPQRRTFLKTGTLTAISAGLTLSTAHSILSQDRGSHHEIPIEAQRDKLFQFTRGTFEPYVGDIFQAPNAVGEMISLTLADVSAYKTKEGTKLTTKLPRETDAFSLTFTSSERLPKFTSIHKLSHPALGEFDLFLTPHQQKDGTYTYAAIINRAR